MIGNQQISLLRSLKCAELKALHFKRFDQFISNLVVAYHNDTPLRNVSTFIGLILRDTAKFLQSLDPSQWIQGFLIYSAFTGDIIGAKLSTNLSTY